jgi:hypothetical protein
MREWHIPIPYEWTPASIADEKEWAKPHMAAYIAEPHLRDITAKHGEISAIFVNGPHRVGVIARWTTPKAPHSYHWFIARLWEQGEAEMTERGL